MTERVCREVQKCCSRRARRLRGRRGRRGLRSVALGLGRLKLSVYLKHILRCVVDELIGMPSASMVYVMMFLASYTRNCQFRTTPEGRLRPNSKVIRVRGESWLIMVFRERTEQSRVFAISIHCVYLADEVR